MNIFSIISLLGGLAMFLYGMKLMSGSLKEGSSVTLKVAMEKVTNNPIKAFFLGLAVTAIIQSSTATIVITSGLVAAGVLSLHQSLGIIIGANVGTTVTGQIIRLLDVNGDSNMVLKFFQPSTLAPLALIIGIVFIMFCKFKKSEMIGNIAIGFGVLFSGLMNMTASVSVLTDSGVFDSLFEGLGNNPLLAYGVGAGVAFILQSSSATIGILQAFSIAGDIPFKAVYIVLVGIYLGDCVTTAIVCSIGAKPEAKRVGVVNILFNLSETVAVILVVTVLHKFGLLENLWSMSMRSGSIANTNTIFNLGCSILLFPLVGVYEKLANKLIKDKGNANGRYADKIDALNPVFLNTPALAFKSCYDALTTMFDVSKEIINKAIDIVSNYDEKIYEQIVEGEDDVDILADNVGKYLVEVSPHVKEDLHISIQDQYYKLVNEFEHLGDYAVYIANDAKQLSDEGMTLSDYAIRELQILRDLMNHTLDYTRTAFVKRDVEAAKHIEPLEEVMDDMLNTLNDNHLIRLREGKCTINGGIIFLDILTNLGRISDTCSNVGVATISRANPGIANLAHAYVSSLHQGLNDEYNELYTLVHDQYFERLEYKESEE